MGTRKKCKKLNPRNNMGGGGGDIVNVWKIIADVDRNIKFLITKSYINLTGNLDRTTSEHFIFKDGQWFFYTITQSFDGLVSSSW